VWAAVMKNFARAVVLLVAALTGACGSGSGTSNTPSPAPSASDPAMTLDASAWDAAQWAE